MEENEVNGNNVAEEYFTDDEALTSKDVYDSLAEEQSREDEDGTNGYLVAKSHSSYEEKDVDDGETEPLTSNNATDSATEEHSNKEEHRDDHGPLTSKQCNCHRKTL